VKCDSSDANAGLLGEDSQLSQRTKVTQNYAERASRLLKEEQNKALSASQEKLDRKLEEIDRKYAKARAKREEEELNECLSHKKEYKARSKYWKRRSKKIGLPKVLKESYKANRYFYERLASEC